jgi:hypothetical protein
MRFLAGTPGCQTVVVLSGDVHYAMTVEVRFTVGDTTVHLAQLVSSALQALRHHHQAAAGPAWPAQPPRPPARRLGQRTRDP